MVLRCFGFLKGGTWLKKFKNLLDYYSYRHFASYEAPLDECTSDNQTSENIQEEFRKEPLMNEEVIEIKQGSAIVWYGLCLTFINY